MKKLLTFSYVKEQSNVLILENLEPTSTHTNTFCLCWLEMRDILVFLTVMSILFIASACMTSTIARRFGCPPDMIIAALISLALKPYPKLVKIELKSSLIKPVGTANTEVPEGSSPFR